MWKSECLPSQADTAVILVFCSVCVQGMQERCGSKLLFTCLTVWLLARGPSRLVLGITLPNIYTLSHRCLQGT